MGNLVSQSGRRDGSVASNTATAPDEITSPPPFLSLSDARDGLAFIGLSMTTKSARGHKDSITRQTAFNFDMITDRHYEYVASTNDDGWLVGGGEPSDSIKLPAPDSAHIEIVRLGTLSDATGGVNIEKIVHAVADGSLLIPRFDVVPTSLVENSDRPPELEVRFDEVMSADLAQDDLPLNWQLRFVMNQVYTMFSFPNRFTPGPFHMTIARKVTFRSAIHRRVYFSKSEELITAWRRAANVAESASVQSARIDSQEEKRGDEKDDSDDQSTDGHQKAQRQYHRHVGDDDGGRGGSRSAPEREGQGGVFIFRDRNTVLGYLAPNFKPPYASDPAKLRIIREVLSRLWDPHSLSWKGVGR